MDDGDLTAKLTELASLLVTDDGLDATLERVAKMSTSLIEACDSCGVSLLRDGTVSTRSASDARADRVDEIQYAQGEGPCLEAIKIGQAVHVDSFADEERWPLFIDRARQEGIRASYSVPLTVRGETLGSLNFYSTGAPFSDADEQMGDVLATQAAAALRNAQTFNEVLALVDQLNEALRSRDVIGQSKGMLMSRFSLTSDDAFQLLRTESQHRNVKLRTLAEEIVAGTSTIDVGPSSNPSP